MVFLGGSSCYHSGTSFYRKEVGGDSYIPKFHLVHHKDAGFSSALLKGVPLKLRFHGANAAAWTFATPLVCDIPCALVLYSFKIFALLLEALAVVRVPSCSGVLDDRPDECGVCLGFGVSVTSREGSLEKLPSAGGFLTESSDVGIEVKF